MAQRTEVPAIRFDATLHKMDKWTIVRLPEKASAKLPSRGQVAVQGTINGHEFQTVLEPDGSGGHWMKIDGKLQQIAAVSAGDTTALEIEPTRDWPEPNVPQDFEAALAAAPQKIQDMWEMNSGKRRPCCFNLAACTDPYLSRNGRLPDSA